MCADSKNNCSRIVDWSLFHDDSDDDSSWWTWVHPTRRWGPCYTPQLLDPAKTKDLFLVREVSILMCSTSSKQVLYFRYLCILYCWCQHICFSRRTRYVLFMQCTIRVYYHAMQIWQDQISTVLGWWNKTVSTNSGGAQLEWTPSKSSGGLGIC